jgi:hypothetical protein
MRPCSNVPSSQAFRSYLNHKLCTLCKHSNTDIDSIRIEVIFIYKQQQQKPNNQRIHKNNKYFYR